MQDFRTRHCPAGARGRHGDTRPPKLRKCQNRRRWCMTAVGHHYRVDGLAENRMRRGLTS